VSRKQYSASLRASVVKAHKSGVSSADLAAKHDVKIERIYAWVTKSRKVAPAKASKATDAERIVTQLLASLRPGLVLAIDKLVDLGVKRKLDAALSNVINSIKEAA